MTTKSVTTLSTARKVTTVLTAESETTSWLAAMVMILSMAAATMASWAETTLSMEGWGMTGSWAAQAPMYSFSVRLMEWTQSSTLLMAKTESISPLSL